MAQTPPRRGLLWTVYFVGVTQIALAAVTVFLVQRIVDRVPWQLVPGAKGTIESYAELFDLPDTLRLVLQKRDDVDLTFYRSDGTILATTQMAIPPLPAAELARLGQGPLLLPTDESIPITAIAVMRDGDMRGYGLIHYRPPPGWPGSVDPSKPIRYGPALASGARLPMPPLPMRPSRIVIAIACSLLGAAIISLLFARSLARPLRQMAAAARALGDGDLQARTGIQRNDEIGAVARTFDEMAGRVNDLLNHQRQFIANVSHELRTPLARIRVALDLAAEGDVQAARESLQLIAEDWDDLDRMIEDLLMVARFELGQDSSTRAIKLELEAVDVRPLVERSLTAFRSLHLHPVELAIEGEGLTVVADGSLLRRVLDNLLQNAGNYSDPSTTIRVGVRQLADAVEFAVTDHGMGIDAADLPHLFEPFFRGDRSRARKTGGVGLGLALAKRIVDAHRGCLAARSTPGEGTTVTFTIPSV